MQRSLLEKIFSDSKEIAYEDAVEKTATNLDGLYFIDPDMFANDFASVGIDYSSLNSPQEVTTAINRLDPTQAQDLETRMGETLEKNLEQQLPGSSEAIFNRLEGDKTVAAKRIWEAGPAIFEKVDVNGKECGFCILPAQFIDTKAKFINLVLKDAYDEQTKKAIIDNMPGDSKKWLEIIAHHEGGHLDNIKRVETPTGILADEAKSDRVAIKEMSTSNPETDMGLAWKDLRALTDTKVDTAHGTSGLLGSNDTVSSLHFKIAGSYQNDMMRNVFDNFDFDTYEGEAEASYGLLIEDPEAFFKVVNDSVEQTKQEAMEAYNADPTSKEAIKTVVGVQIHADYVNSSEGAFMRRVQGQLDFPEAPPTQLIPQEVEDQFYADLKHENNINFLEREHIFNSYDEHFPDRKINWPTLEDGMQIRPEYLKSEDPERYFNLQREYLDNLKAKTYEQAEMPLIY